MTVPAPELGVGLAGTLNLPTSRVFFSPFLPHLALLPNSQVLFAS